MIMPQGDSPLLSNGRASLSVLVNASTGHLLVPIESQLAGPSRHQHAATGHLQLSAIPLVTIIATDADSGANGELLYTIRSGNEAGVIRPQPNLGQLFINITNASRLTGSEWELGCGGRPRQPLLADKPCCRSCSSPVWTTWGFSP